jgi:hypothetical protein
MAGFSLVNIRALRQEIDEMWGVFTNLLSRVQPFSQGRVESPFNQFNNMHCSGLFPADAPWLTSPCLVPVYHGQEPNLYSATGETLDI